ncbi:MAG: PP2C family protein-serine/threonine phosphatase [Armatimonadota bacterium]
MRILFLISSSILSLTVAYFDINSQTEFDLGILYLIPTLAVSSFLGIRYGFIFAAFNVFIENLNLILTEKFSLFSADFIAFTIMRIVVYFFTSFLVAKISDGAEEVENYANKLKKAMDKMEWDINSAALLQAGLITPKTPKIDGLDISARLSYSEWVGGDYLDVRKINGKLFFCIGDVSGKGVQAALFTAALKNLLNQIVTTSSTPSEVLCYLNSELGGFMPTEMFVTMFCGFIDTERMKLIYASAGHDSQLLLKSSGEIKRLQTTGTILSLMEDLIINDRSIDLDEGDLLFFFTDGALDVPRPEGRPGIEGVEKLLIAYNSNSAKETLDNVFLALVSDVERYSRDDITLICIKILQKTNPSKEILEW